MGCQWDTSFVGVSDFRFDQGHVILNFVSKVAQCLVTGLTPRNCQLAMIMPTETIDMDKVAVLGEQGVFNGGNPTHPFTANWSIQAKLR